jgi:hypothetical protein
MFPLLAAAEVAAATTATASVDARRLVRRARTANDRDSGARQRRFLHTLEIHE